MSASFSSASAVAASRISRSPLRNTRMSPGPSAAARRPAARMPSTWSRRPAAGSASRPGRSGPTPRRPGRRSGRRSAGVDGRRRDDELEVGAAGQQVREVAEQEVDVEAALVGLVDDDRVVAAQQAVALQLGQQDAVGHELDQRVLADLVGEAHRVADEVAELGAQLLGDAGGHRAGRQPAGLGVPDERLRTPRPSSRHIFGSCVLLPDPVSPATTRPPGGRGWRRAPRRAAR